VTVALRPAIDTNWRRVQHGLDSVQLSNGGAGAVPGGRKPLRSLCFLRPPPGAPLGPLTTAGPRADHSATGWLPEANAGANYSLWGSGPRQVWGRLLEVGEAVRLAADRFTLRPGSRGTARLLRRCRGGDDQEIPFIKEGNPLRMASRAGWQAPAGGPADLVYRRALRRARLRFPGLDPPLGTRQAAYELRVGCLPSVPDRRETRVSATMSIVLLRPSRDVPALAAGPDNAGA
jgi:hypothetical protein